MACSSSLNLSNCPLLYPENRLANSEYELAHFVLPFILACTNYFLAHFAYIDMLELEVPGAWAVADCQVGQSFLWLLSSSVARHLQSYFGLYFWSMMDIERTGLVQPKLWNPLLAYLRLNCSDERSIKSQSLQPRQVASSTGPVMLIWVHYFLSGFLKTILAICFPPHFESGTKQASRSFTPAEQPAMRSKSREHILAPSDRLRPAQLVWS